MEKLVVPLPKRPVLVYISKLCVALSFVIIAIYIVSFGAFSATGFLDFLSVFFNLNSTEMILLSLAIVGTVTWLLSLLHERFIVAPRQGALSSRNLFELISCLLLLSAPLAFVTFFLAVFGFCFVNGNQVGCSTLAGFAAFPLLLGAPVVAILGICGFIFSLIRFR